MSVKSVRLVSAPTISNIAGMHGAKEDHPSMLPLPFPGHVTVKCIPWELVHCLTCQPSKKSVSFTHSFKSQVAKKSWTDTKDNTKVYTGLHPSALGKLC